MSAKFRVSIATDVAPSIEAWRAAGWAVDEVAKHAVLRIRKEFHKHLQSNTPWIETAINYRRLAVRFMTKISLGIGVLAWPQMAGKWRGDPVQRSDAGQRTFPGR